MRTRHVARNVIWLFVPRKLLRWGCLSWSCNKQIQINRKRVEQGQDCGWRFGSDDEWALCLQDDLKRMKLPYMRVLTLRITSRVTFKDQKVSLCLPLTCCRATGATSSICKPENMLLLLLPSFFLIKAASWSNEIRWNPASIKSIRQEGGWSVGNDVQMLSLPWIFLRGGRARKCGCVCFTERDTCLT